MLARLRQRLRTEEGFGLIELLTAMVLLSIAIAALIGIFMAGAFSVARAGHQGTATVIIDRVFEYYRRAPWYDIRLVKSGPGSSGGVTDTDVTSDAQYTSTTQCNGCPAGSSSAVVDEDAGTSDEYGSASNPAHLGTEAVNNTSTCNTGLSGGSDASNPDKDPTAPITNCLSIAKVQGADGDYYRVYTYMKYACAAGTSGGGCTADYKSKVITVAVRLLNQAGTALSSTVSAGILAEQTATFSYGSYATQITCVSSDSCTSSG
jgi:Tfp pilus assembly protein PilV